MGTAWLDEDRRRKPDRTKQLVWLLILIWCVLWVLTCIYVMRGLVLGTW